MRAALVITGSELLTGFRQDALVQPFCAQLLSRSITVQEVRLLGDDPETLLETLPSLCAGLELIVITGGLGRTPDDTTRGVIERLRPQALSIEELANPVGAERGVCLTCDRARCLFLPGVPREALAMLEGALETLAPREIPPPGRIGVFGLREVHCAERLGPLAHECAFLPGEMELTLIAPSRHEERIRGILGRHALEEPDLAHTVGALLGERRLTCASAESCTGGLVGHLLTQPAGASAYFLGGVVTYSNALKMKVLGVPEAVLRQQGAVSRAVAQAMLAGLLALTGADVGVATTGIAGPTGGSDDKPVGTVWVAVGSKDIQRAQVFHFAFDRTGNKLVSAKTALFELRNFIHDQDLCGH